MTEDRKSIYKEALLDHYRHPRNRGELDGADVIKRGRNPRCGDEVELGLHFEGDRIDWIRFRGRGCSVCIASASMLTEAVTGKSREEIQVISKDMHAWFSHESDQAPAQVLQPLEVTRIHPSRQRCVMLSWEALDEALGEGG